MENFKLGEAALKQQLPTGETDIFHSGTIIILITCSVEVLCVSHSELEQWQIIKVS